MKEKKKSNSEKGNISSGDTETDDDKVISETKSTKHVKHSSQKKRTSTQTSDEDPRALEKAEEAKTSIGTVRKSILTPEEEESVAMDVVHEHLAGAMIFYILLLSGPSIAMLILLLSEARRKIVVPGVQWGFIAVFSILTLAYRFIRLPRLVRLSVLWFASLFLLLSFCFLHFAPFRGRDDGFSYVAICLGLLNTLAFSVVMGMFFLQKRFYFFSIVGLLILSVGFIAIQGIIALLLFAPDYGEDDKAVLSVIYVYSLMMSFLSTFLIVILCAKVMNIDVIQHPRRTGHFIYFFVGTMQLVFALLVYFHQAFLCYNEEKKSSDCVV